MKRIVSVQDISCLGKCSLTVALPIISAMGVECSILPTAVLSTHTMFKNFTCKDLTDQINPIAHHWQQEGFQFRRHLHRATWLPKSRWAMCAPSLTPSKPRTT